MEAYEPPHRTFEVEVPPDAKGPRFTIKFMNLASGMKEEEKFECLPLAPFSAHLNIFTAADRDESRAMIGRLSFITRVLTEDSRKRWNLLADDQTRLVDAPTITRAYDWLVEEYAKRPTRSLSGSAAGQRTTPDTSADGA